MKRRIVAGLRAFGVLGAADVAWARVHVLKAESLNRGVRAAHPDIAFPPPALVFEVQAYARLDWFLETGERHAAALAALIQAHTPADRPSTILEWGCGPGRLLRPLQAALGDHAALFGCDPMPAYVDAARRFAPTAAIALSERHPPAPYPGAEFDVVYGVSILTHLDAQACTAWMAEIARLLRPGGVAILTVHGARQGVLLGPSDAARFAAGQHVVLDRVPEGSRAFASFTPPAAMSRFAEGAGLRIMAHHEDGPAAIIGQDVWVLEKPPQG